ncbi:TetR family transcriptional regulator [Bordetella ansorpii]|uniref:TetR family transcriptional regulator n=1 Tax=Bordetella ansorpii TaxID=288768 RepID=A0A157SMT6_9BORD|nr:TetR/AcrR family transcriptional regulator [Bordetella ansorpii]SAI71483.1 TetR family transcriptional regulator [Bordetella ansorpii]
MAPSLSHTPDKKQATRDRILAAASRTLRRRGLDKVGVAEVMTEAGLTHGGFYAHFASREAMLAEALERSRRDMADVLAQRIALQRQRGASAFRALVQAYLADANLAAFETACPVSALASDLARCAHPADDTAPGALQAAARALVSHLIAGVRDALPPIHRQAAPAVASMLVGALQLARTLGDGPQARAVLAAARTTLLNQYDPGPGNA